MIRHNRIAPQSVVATDKAYNLLRRPFPSTPLQHVDITGLDVNTALHVDRAGRWDMAVYGYVRVSTDVQAEDGQSLAVQQRQLEGWAMQHGRTFDAMHIEAGISGAIPFAERPEGSQLWDRLAKGDVLVASKLDRM